MDVSVSLNAPWTSSPSHRCTQGLHNSDTHAKTKRWLNVEGEGLFWQVPSSLQVDVALTWRGGGGAGSWYVNLLFWTSSLKRISGIVPEPWLAVWNPGHSCLPCVWRRWRPVRRPCTAGRRSLSWWGGRWSIRRWGRSGRARPLPRTRAAAPAPCPCPSPRSAARSMTPTWTMPRPVHRQKHTHRETLRGIFPQL